MAILVKWILNGLSVIAASYLLSGVHVDSFTTALVIALVLGVINVTLKPLLILLTLPANILTFGLFILVINAILVLLADAIIPGFAVDGFLWAFLFSLVVSTINSLLQKAFK